MLRTIWSKSCICCNLTGILFAEIYPAMVVSLPAQIGAIAALNNQEYYASSIQ